MERREDFGKIRNLLAISLSVFLLAIGSPSVLASSGSHQVPPTVAYGGSLSSSGSSTGHPPSATFLCSAGTSMLGVYQGPSGGAWGISYYGNLIWCSLGTATVIASPPSGAPTAGYYGMAGISSKSFGTILVADYAFGGFFFCIGASPTGCSIESAYVNITASYCESTGAGSCGNQGIALDSKLNVYVVDETNNDIFKCTYASAYKTCTVVEPSSDFAGSEVVYIFRDASGNLWVDDFGCNGHVWENGLLKYTVGESLYGITESKANPSKTEHVYVSLTGNCGNLSPSIKDLNDGKFLSVPVSDSYTLTTSLQIAGFTGNVYKISDKV